MSRKILSSLILLGFFSAIMTARAAPKKAKADPKKAAAAAKAEAATTPPPVSTEHTEKEAAKKHAISDDLMEAIKNKRLLNDKDFEKKKDGVYFTPLPLFNVDSNTGIGYGGRVYMFNNGERDNPLFRRTPYRSQFYAQFFQTTNGYQYHELNLDAPYVANSLFRFRSALVFEKNIWANFYGVGGRTMNALGSDFAGGAKTYDKYKDYFEAINAIDSAGNTNAAYNKYEYTRPALVATIERDMFGGIVRPILGMQISRYTISDLAYTKVKMVRDGFGTGETMNNATLLTQYCNTAGAINGCSGGFHNTVRAGIAIDTRDYEPNPNKGQMFEAIAEVSNKAYGSEFNFARYTVSEKFFISPFEKLIDLVLAGRAVYTQAVGDVPFYAMNQFSSTERTYQSALGGLRSLRGFRENRFVATNIALANLELRWTMFDFKLAGQHFAPILVPFFDIGSAFDQPKDVSTSAWKYAYGAGVRIAWNQATIIMVDYAMSKEDSSMFINFSHIF